ncbi:MAG: ABC transporter ATP-binding protein [Haloarculaceae archaeon]
MTRTTLQRVRDAGESGAPALSVRGLTKRYGDVTAVDDVTFSVEPGAVVGLLGPNGAGKTTILRTALGLVAPSAGSVAVNGVDVLSAPARTYREVGAMLEGTRNVYWQLTPRENLAFFAGLQGIDARERREAHADLLASLDLVDLADDPVGSLARGQRRRVALACALARETPVVVLDEPTLGLDVEAAYALRTRIRELAGDDRTVVLSSHDADVVQEVCDRAVVLSGGRLVADRPVSDLLGAHRARAYRVTLASDLPAGVRRDLEAAHGIERWQSVPQGVRFEVTVADATAFYDLVADLRDAEADVVSVSAVEPSLEDAVLHLTR